MHQNFSFIHAIFQLKPIKYNVELVSKWASVRSKSIENEMEGLQSRERERWIERRIALSSDFPSDKCWRIFELKHFICQRIVLFNPRCIELLNSRLLRGCHVCLCSTAHMKRVKFRSAKHLLEPSNPEHTAQVRKTLTERDLCFFGYFLKEFSENRAARRDWRNRPNEFWNVFLRNFMMLFCISFEWKFSSDIFSGFVMIRAYDAQSARFD